MRNFPTKWELILSKYLSELNYNFISQVPIICKGNHGYIMDFVLIDYNIFIECNSKQYHYSNKEQIKADNKRNKRISKEGYKPLILTNRQISTYTRDMIDQIIKTKIQLIVNNS